MLLQLLGLNETSDVLDPSAVEGARKLALHNFIGTVRERDHRRRMKTEGKAKVVAVVWGTYLN